jgi:hypothetical protein
LYALAKAALQIKRIIKDGRANGKTMNISAMPKMNTNV